MKPEPMSVPAAAGGPPLISVFMPVYNGERFIAEAIASILAQTFRSLELVVVDDGSADRTCEIAASFQRRDHRVRIVRHAANLGVSAAHNTGWQSVSPDSSFIMNHDSDDISLPCCLERLVGYLSQHPEIHAAGSFCDYIDETGRTIGPAHIEWNPAFIRATFGILNSMAISATLVRREVYEQMAPFRPEFGCCDDYDFWSRSLQSGFRLANVPEVLHLIRLHGQSITSTQVVEMKRLSDAIGLTYRNAAGHGAAGEMVGRTLVKTLRARGFAHRWLHSVMKRKA